MPRIFSEVDRQAIRRSLLDAGRRQFLRFGIRRTNVAELAAAAGIAKGTFYHFFGSKEDLCMEIFDEEEKAMRANLQLILARHDDPAEALQEVVKYALDFVRTDSLLKVLRETGEYPMLARGVRREKLSQHFAVDLEFISALLDALREKGAKCAVAPAVVLGVLRAIVLLQFHEDEVGPDVFDEVVELLVAQVSELIVDGGPGEP